MINTQPRERRVDLNYLSVHSIFETIQGEGPFCGMPCVFVRLAGCNLQCPKCDTDYTSGRQNMSAEAILADVFEKRNSGLVVITGGEPFRQNIRELCWTLLDAGYMIQIESNGTLPAPMGLPYERDPFTHRRAVYVVCSPKADKVQHTIAEIACCFKYVVQAGNIDITTGLPLQALENVVKSHVAQPPEGWDRPIYIQPMDDKDEDKNRRNYAAAVQSCLRFGHTLQVQIHKVVGVE